MKLKLLPAPKPGENFLPLSEFPALKKAEQDRSTAIAKLNAARDRLQAAEAAILSIEASVVEGEIDIDQVAGKLTEASNAAHLGRLNLKACERGLHLAEAAVVTAREEARRENTRRAGDLFRRDVDELTKTLEAALVIKERLVATQQEASANGASISAAEVNVFSLLTREYVLRECKQIKNPKDHPRAEIASGMVLVRVLRAPSVNAVRNPISNILQGEICSVPRDDVADLIAKGFVEEVKSSNQPPSAVKSPTRAVVSTMLVRFVSPFNVSDYGAYGPGEVAGFPGGIAERLVSSGVAEYHNVAA